MHATAGRHRVRTHRAQPTASAPAAVAVACVLGMLASGTLIWHRTAAAFTATTRSQANSWLAGTVAVANNSSAAAVFTVTGLVPGSTGQKCVTVTYNGNLPATAKLYLTSVSGALGGYLDMVIQEGTAGTNANCSDFAATSTLATGTLTTVGAARTSFGTGVGTFAPTAAGQTRRYRFAYTLNAAAPDSVQGGTAAATFTWEAQG
ncbi:MAG TPA: hypothetical protein VES42_27820 [Pilimelia sp.]|nr:hypothetical protein [Pilimelia sp.]